MRILRLFCTLVFSIAVVALPSLSARAFTLEQVMSAPFCSELTAAPSAGRVAWVQNDRGVRNIWVAEPPEYRARQLTAYTDDDGQEIGDLAWTPDAKTILYVHGGAPNRRGEIPNPTDNVSGEEQAVWRISFDGGSPVKVGIGHSPAVSPKGEQVVFIDKGQVLRATLGADGEAKALFKIRGSTSSLRWSPDGTKLAFVSRRPEHSLIGIWSEGSKSILFLSPSVDRDRSPVWSPDGSKIAFIRIPTATPHEFEPKRTAEPWSILIADPSSGKATTLWRADAGDGSAFRRIVSRDELLWTADGRIVFPWEKDGWTHLYSVKVQRGSPTLMTPGDFEVEYVSLSPDRRSVLFNSNQGDIDRRHLWRVSTDGGKPSEITKGDGLEWAPVVASDGATIVYLHSDARMPSRAAIRTASGETRDLAPATIPRDFPAADLVVPQQVIFDAADGMKIHGQLFLPKISRAGEKHPAIVFFHGGSQRQMLLGWHYMRYYSNAYAMNQYLASRGFVVLSVNYRSGIGYGMKFREAINYGAAGASEFNDVLGAGLYLRSRPDVDGKRIGLWGGSYGGYLTALGLARASDLFAAGVDLHGVHDWNVVIRNFVPSYDPLERVKEARLAFESSPMASISTWRSPVLVIQGDDDRNVPFSETVGLVEALRKQKVEVEQLIFPDEVHDFLLHSSWLRAYHAAAGFFERKLGAGAAAP